MEFVGWVGLLQGEVGLESLYPVLRVVSIWKKSREGRQPCLECCKFEELLYGEVLDESDGHVRVWKLAGRHLCYGKWPRKWS